MEKSRIHGLILRYLTYTCTNEERVELAKLISQLSDDELYDQIEQVWMDFDSPVRISKEKAMNMLANILDTEYQSKHLLFPRTISRKVIRTMTTAAAILVLVGIGTFVKHLTVVSTSSQAVFAKAIPLSPQKAASYIRNLILPDGTSVILKSGSTLRFPETFTGNTREVVLKGEAYFDVKHMSSKPFIIHTGVVKTTVLGTAFDIKAWPQDKSVNVYVTRGKVRVENENKTLAILTVNQSVNYNTENTVAKQQTVNAEKVVNNWTKQDMVFNRARFESITQILSKRYGKNITIADPKLANTQITSSFSGIESLESILEILCAVNANTQYSMSADEIKIINRN